MKLETWHAPEDKKRYAIVRRDYCGPNGGRIEGEIESADEATGEVAMKINGENKTLNFGPNWISIVKQRVYDV